MERSMLLIHSLLSVIVPKAVNLEKSNANDYKNGNKVQYQLLKVFANKITLNMKTHRLTK